MVNKKSAEFINKFKERFIELGDGIYFLYCDYLSGDAAHLFVVEDKKIVREAQPWCFSTRNYYGDGKPCGIVPTLKSMKEEHSEYSVFVANVAYYTFPNTWKNVGDEYVGTLAKYGISSQMIDVDDLIQE